MLRHQIKKPPTAHAVEPPQLPSVHLNRASGVPFPLSVKPTLVCLSPPVSRARTCGGDESRAQGGGDAQLLAPCVMSPYRTTALCLCSHLLEARPQGATQPQEAEVDVGASAAFSYRSTDLCSRTRSLYHLNSSPSDHPSIPLNPLPILFSAPLFSVSFPLSLWLFINYLCYLLNMSII